MLAHVMSKPEILDEFLTYAWQCKPITSWQQAWKIPLKIRDLMSNQWEFILGQEGVCTVNSELALNA